MPRSKASNIRSKPAWRRTAMPRSHRDDEAVLSRLAAGRDRADPGFLAGHHLAAADRFERLIRRAQLVQRVTMSYDPARLGGRNGAANGVESASEGAAQA